MSAPGTYESHFDALDPRYKRLPPRRVEVGAGDPTPVLVELELE